MNDLQISSSRHFSAWLAEQGVSLAFTTYQAGKLFMLGTRPDGNLSVFERSIDRCMGLAARGSSLYVSSLYQIWRFENVMGHETNPEGYDACFTPQMSWVTGDIDVHDMMLDGAGQLTFVNTLFGCLARLSEKASFAPVWQPGFLSRLAAEDRCHLNGLAGDNDGPVYVTALSDSDVADGWRDRRADGGVVVHVPSGNIVARGLSMPHSPRLKDGKLYLLNSGTGYFGNLDPETGEFEAIAFCPGYARGLAFVGDHAVIGLSLPRGANTFGGLPLDAALTDKRAAPRCGLIVVDLKTGDTVHSLRIDGPVAELFDVTMLSNVRMPSMVGFRTEEVRRVISIGKAD